MPITEALAAVIGAGITGITNFGTTIGTNIMNKRMADEQYARQKRDLQLMNSYNSPASQVARLRAAGINPAMAFQNGVSASAGEQSALPSYDRATYAAPTLDSQAVVSAYTGVAHQLNENKRTAQELKEMVLDYNFKLENNPQLIEQAEIAIRQGEENIDKTIAEYSQIVAGTKLAEVNIQKVAQDMQINAVGLMRTIMMLPREMLNMDADTALKYSQKAKNEWDMTMAYANLVAAFNGQILNYAATTRGQDLSYQTGMASVAANLAGTDVAETGNILGFISDLIQTGATIGGAFLLAKGRGLKPPKINNF